MQIKVISKKEAIAMVSHAELLGRGIKPTDFKRGSKAIKELMDEIVEKAQNAGFAPEEDAFSISIDMSPTGLVFCLEKVSLSNLGLPDDDSDDVEDIDDCEEKNDSTTTILRFHKLFQLLDFISLVNENNDVEVYEDNRSNTFYLILKGSQEIPMCNVIAMEYCTETTGKISEEYIKEHYTLFLRKSSANRLREVLL